ncbi:MAG TPA: SPOR domain-containing protein [Bacteroidales bacterium]|nr:SPOR domain-containing protein [Bacteroidales bacterium]
MKSKIVGLILLAILATSCAKMHKAQKEQPNASEEATRPTAREDQDIVDDPPITEKEEKIVEQDDKPLIQNHYYVIIGSFKNPDNARTYQEQIASDGFSSVLLRNEEGLYRVSVMSTNTILQARNEIRRIRTRFDKYDDTWLLISVRFGAAQRPVGE